MDLSNLVGRGFRFLALLAAWRDALNDGRRSSFRRGLYVCFVFFNLFVDGGIGVGEFVDRLIVCFPVLAGRGVSYGGIGSTRIFDRLLVGYSLACFSLG